MEILVSGCVDCPLCKIDFGLKYYCGHPAFNEYFIAIEFDDNEELITPNICPLNSYPLMLKKEEWQSFELFWQREN